MANDAVGQAERKLREAVWRLREDGATWGVVGSALNMSAQAAHKRFA